MSQESDASWWKRFFDIRYGQEVLPERESDRLNEIVERILRLSEAGPGSVVFDQCCGIGRLSLPMARRGLTVQGVDFAAEYVRLAKERADAELLSCTFHHADAREFRTPVACDAAINWFTSWGYEEDDQQNLAMLRAAHDSLRPGGIYLLELPNFARVLTTFRACDVQRPAASPEGTMIVIESWCDFAAGMLRSRWTWIAPDGTRTEQPAALRMLLPDAVLTLLRQAGFSDVKVVGGDEQMLTLQSNRAIFIARR